jgi:hypothetical protein
VSCFALVLADRASAQTTVFDFATDNGGFSSQSVTGAPSWAFSTGTDFFGNRLGWSLNGSSTVARTRLVSPVLTAAGGPIQVTFSHQFNFDRGVDLLCRDGGVFTSAVGTNPFTPSATTSSGQAYVALINGNFGNPLSGSSAFCGPSANNQIGQFVESTFTLSAQPFQQFRFAFEGGFDSAGRAIPDPNWRINRVTVRQGVAVVPEPSTYALLATGLLAVIGVQRSRKRSV